MTKGRAYTPEELSIIRLMHIKAVVKAEEASKKRGYTIDPRIAAAHLK